MFTLLTAAAPPCPRDQHVTRPVCTTKPANDRTFMDIFACKQCKKNKRNRSKQSADNAGYSSTEEEEYSGPSTVAEPPRQSSNQNEGSQKRPLTCKLPFGKRAPSKKDNKTKSPTDESSGGSSFLETWRSLPNLRSPSLAVRAMTIKFKTLTGRDDAANRTKPKKKARFNEAVDVILTDDDGNPLYTQSVKIKFDDDDSAHIQYNNMAAANDHVNGSQTRVPSLGRSPTPEMIRMDYMDIRRQPSGQKYFKCVIFIGKDFDRRSITVRTAMGGSRLVLIAYKSEPLGDGTDYLRQYVEKFRLPHAIDPNQVNAVMHAAGDLVIEAPLFEYDADN